LFVLLSCASFEPLSRALRAAQTSPAPFNAWAAGSSHATKATKLPPLTHNSSFPPTTWLSWREHASSTNITFGASVSPHR